MPLGAWLSCTLLKKSSIEISRPQIYCSMGLVFFWLLDFYSLSCALLKILLQLTLNPEIYSGEKLMWVSSRWQNWFYTHLIDAKFHISFCFLQDYNAKISDFGLAKLGPAGGQSHVTTRVMGTYGYAAPEYIATGNYIST